MTDEEPGLPARVDVLVIGAGMAGLTAAARAALDGARVLVVEKAPAVGGSALFAGYVWTAPSRAVMAQVNPQGDVALRNAIVDRFDTGIEWIRSLGVEVGAPQTILGWGRGMKFDTHQYVEAARRLVTDLGGVIVTSTRPARLIVGLSGVEGADVVSAEDLSTSVRATSVVLATGGFQNSRELRTERIHLQAGGLPVRSNPVSDGAGLRLGSAVGAATGPPGAGFYGHLVPAGISLRAEEFVSLALYYSEHAVLFNLHNRRFVDETLGDHLTTNALLAQPEARGLLIGDARVHRDFITRPYVANAEANDKYALAERRGARCGVADSIDELTLLPLEWGYDGSQIAARMEHFNRTVNSGVPEPGRALDPLALDEPPFYVVEVTPAVTFPFHGLKIDSAARVLGGQGNVIDGLYAAGADAGGYYGGAAYAGGIAAALAFGLAAGSGAATRGWLPARSDRQK